MGSKESPLLDGEEDAVKRSKEMLEDAICAWTWGRM